MLDPTMAIQMPGIVENKQQVLMKRQGSPSLLTGPFDLPRWAISVSLNTPLVKHHSNKEHDKHDQNNIWDGGRRLKLTSFADQDINHLFTENKWWWWWIRISHNNNNHDYLIVILKPIDS